MSLAALALFLAPAAATAAPLPATAVPDAELARERGGFRLPSGIDVALTVQTQTALNGAVVLQTQFKIDAGAPVLTVFAPKPGEIVAAPAAAAGTGTAGMPTITYDSRSGIQITPGVGQGPAVGASPAALAAGLQEVAAGEVLATDAGVVSRTGTGGLQAAELRAADLTVTHLAGSAFGSAIANSGSDRSIDTQTALTIDLRNAGPDVLGSAMLRVEGIALDALRFRQ